MAMFDTSGYTDDDAAASGRLWDQMSPTDEPCIMGVWFGNMTMSAHRNRHYQLRWCRGLWTDKWNIAQQLNQLRAKVA